MSPAPIWRAPSPGGGTLVGHATQFLAAHSSTFTYAGTTIGTDPTLSGTADQVGAGQLAMKVDLSSGAVLSRVGLALGRVAAGQDVLVSLQADNGSGHPTGVPLVGCFLPAEWLASGVQSVQGLWSVPLPYTLVGSTAYYVVVTPGGYSLGGGLYSQGAAGVNDVELTRSTLSTGAQTYNPSTATWTSQTYGYGLYLRGGLGGALTNAADDVISSLAYLPPSKVASYYWSSGLLDNVGLWTARSFSTPFNILCRDDASFEFGTGTYTGTNATITQSSTHSLEGSNSLRLSCTSTGNMSAETGNGTFPATYYPVASSTQYTTVASFYAGSTTRSVEVGVAWYTSGGSLISTSTGSSIAEVASTWTQAFVTATSPSNAAYARLVVTVLSPTTSELHYVDCVQLQAGSGTVWIYPGVGLGSYRALSYTSGVLTGIA